MPSLTPELNATYHGQCHCGAVTFEVTAPKTAVITRCNCSICRAFDYWHLIVGATDFVLKSGRDHLRTYTFGTGTAKHLFCRSCGVKSYYIPRSHPHGFSVNARCLTDFDAQAREVHDFDGQNYDSNLAQLSAAVTID